MRIKLTEKELKAALKELVIVGDTRELTNIKEGEVDHIQEWMKKSKKKFVRTKIDFGDYTCYIPKGTIKGIEYDLWFDKLITIERKKDLDEIATNFGSGDYPRISKEFAHLKANGTRVYIFVEDYLMDKHIRAGRYISKYNPKSLHSRMKSFEAKYNTKFVPIHKDYIGSEIYNTMYYFVRDYLSNKMDIIIDIEEELCVTCTS